MNRIQLAVYFAIGKYISVNTRSQAWGSHALEFISDQLRREQPGLRGFSENSMKNMRKFYEQWQILDTNSSVATDELQKHDNSTIAIVGSKESNSTIAIVESPPPERHDNYMLFHLKEAETEFEGLTFNIEALNEEAYKNKEVFAVSLVELMKCKNDKKREA